MKNLFQILFCLLISIAGFAQGREDTAFGQMPKDTVAQKEKRFSLNIFYSPSYCYRTSYTSLSDFSIGGGSGFPLTSIYRSNNEIAKISHGFGVSIEENISSHLALDYGLSYLNLGYKTKLIDTLITYYNDGFVSTIDTLFHNSKFVFNYRFISVPLIVKFRIINGPFTYCIGVGLSYCRRVKTDFTDLNTSKVTDIYNPVGGNNYLLGVLNGRIECELNMGISIFIEPAFNYSINSIENYGDIARLYSFAMNLGLHIKR